ncbi:hypothetical protein FI667_g7694, partial [Globisporangium splendens]
MRGERVFTCVPPHPAACALLIVWCALSPRDLVAAHSTFFRVESAANSPLSQIPRQTRAPLFVRSPPSRLNFCSRLQVVNMLARSRGTTGDEERHYAKNEVHPDFRRARFPSSSSSSAVSPPPLRPASPPASTPSFGTPIPVETASPPTRKLPEALAALSLPDTPTTKKRPRSDNAATAGSPHRIAPPPPAKASDSDPQRKVPLTATHELRLLRCEVAQLEDELLELNSKWEEQIPDPLTLRTARRAVKEKWQANQVEQLSAQLHSELSYQQFVVASLQTRLLQSPLFSDDQQLYSSVHERIQLGRDPAERAAALEGLFQRATRKLPSALTNATRGVVPSANPHSQTRVTGARDHTLVSSIFVAEIPHASFQDVFDATLSYFAALPVEMERHTGTSMHATELQHFGDYLDYSRIRYTSKAIESTSNYATGVSVVDGVGVFFVDVIDHDELYPSSSEESVTTACSALTITPTTDEATGARKMVLRRVLVARYNLSPETAAVQENTKLCTPIANGDLLIATVVRFLQQKQQQQMTTQPMHHYLGGRLANLTE